MRRLRRPAHLSACGWRRVHTTGATTRRVVPGGTSKVHGPAEVTRRESRYRIAGVSLLVRLGRRPQLETDMATVEALIGQRARARDVVEVLCETERPAAVPMSR